MAPRNTIRLGSDNEAQEAARFYTATFQQLPRKPGKSRFTIPRSYGPPRPWIDKTRHSGEIELAR